MSISTKQEKEKPKPRGNPNPSPSTRFGAENANPQSSGHWKSEDNISFQYNKFLRMPIAEFGTWIIDNPVHTVAQDVAHEAVRKSRNDLQHLKEISDRTEGKPQIRVDNTSGGKPMTTTPLIVSDIPGEVDIKEEGEDA